MAACVLCRASDLRPVYLPEGTLRQAVVHVCQRCGLAQTLPRQARGDGQARLTAGADYGNLRTGKRERVADHLALLEERLPELSPARVLDVGASRGDFVKAALALWPGCRVTAVEPDRRLGKMIGERVTWTTARIEEFTPMVGGFDLVYLSHTLEHLAEPRVALERLATWTRPAGGWLLAEVPDLEFIGRRDVMEEWFIDKHVNHFSTITFHAILKASGWRPLWWGPAGWHLTALCARGGPVRPTLTDEPVRVDELVERYARNRMRNEVTLFGIVSRWNLVANFKRVAVWGNGRILEAVKRAGLNLARVAVVDRAGPDRPEVVLPEVDPDYVLVCSREYFEEIKALAARLCPGAEVRRWDDPPEVR